MGFLDASKVIQVATPDCIPGIRMTSGEEYGVHHPTPDMGMGAHYSIMIDRVAS